jgi:hypothetical protein
MITDWKAEYATLEADCRCGNFSDDQITRLAQRAFEEGHKVGRAEITDRRFPIQNGPSIPWEIIADCEAQARINHDQSIEQLSSRGGLSPGEAVAVLMGKRYKEVWPHGEGGTVVATLLNLVKERSATRVESKSVAEAIKEGRQTALDQVHRVVDQFLKSRWPDTGDRPSPPPPGVLALADTLMALK